MKNVCQILSGLNGSSLVKGLRFGPSEFIRACRDSHAAAHPLESREGLSQKKVNDDLNLIPKVPLGDLIDSTLDSKGGVLNF
jgi:hypothetical protein